MKFTEDLTVTLLMSLTLKHQDVTRQLWLCILWYFVLYFAEQHLGLGDIMIYNVRR